MRFLTPVEFAMLRSYRGSVIAAVAVLALVVVGSVVGLRTGASGNEAESTTQDNALAQAVARDRRDAEQGAPDAQFRMGIAYDQGSGVPRDRAEAVKWWRMAAEQGHDGAQENLGIAYSVGEGAPLDLIAAHKWLSIAASQGRESARDARNFISWSMSFEQIAEAQRQAEAWSATFERAAQQ